MIPDDSIDLIKLHKCKRLISTSGYKEKPSSTSVDFDNNTLFDDNIFIYGKGLLIKIIWINIVKVENL